MTKKIPFGPVADFRKRVKEISKIKTTQVPVNFESLLYVLTAVPIKLQVLLFNYLYWDLKLKSALLALQKKCKFLDIRQN